MYKNRISISQLVLLNVIRTRIYCFNSASISRKVAMQQHEKWVHKFCTHFPTGGKEAPDEGLLIIETLRNNKETDLYKKKKQRLTLGSADNNSYFETRLLLSQTRA